MKGFRLTESPRPCGAPPFNKGGTPSRKPAVPAWCPLGAPKAPWPKGGLFPLPTTAGSPSKLYVSIHLMEMAVHCAHFHLILDVSGPYGYNQKWKNFGINVKTKCVGETRKGRSMDILELLGVFGGLALFLHGMQMMSSGLEAAAGNRMKSFLERLTANRFMGILVGALITTAVQSSSATTVMVVGFVNAGMMSLNQAVWLIMGANVGKTTTGLLIALDVGALAPLVAFIGVFMMMFLTKPSLQHIGQLLAGLGVLFIGMDMMSAAMEPLREVPAFVNMMATLSNPILGILFGTVFTALIQSSAGTPSGPPACTSSSTSSARWFSRWW